MKTKNYQSTIVADITPEEAFEGITRVGNWWTKSFQGSAKKVNDAFSVRFGETSVDFKVTEVIPGKKMTWLVTRCFLHWIHDKTEWMGTSIQWDISLSIDGTKITMTHVGLVPGVECFDDCKTGWDGYLTKSLFKLFTEKKGTPDMQAA